MLSSIAASIRGRNRSAISLVVLLTVAPAGHAADPEPNLESKRRANMASGDFRGDGRQEVVIASFLT
jgi:hypothetical protein